ncbi:MAG: hypothetical protein H5U08_15915 [Thermogutta sp.]|uniref:hypothetical protein n=1 Tax=Thermogutta sp. TaxID=1962930 RepID=UPI0019C9F8F4|nr:hypothetical protein [Thermogutta sp.]MBC7353849.1 hypothetical protein [Thermogutta sp.]GIX02550.1 MAG: hypothetical protein KatS3mg112_1487 [Thermogutta sp.]
MTDKPQHSQPERTPYQEAVIRRYYENRDTLMLQKLGDMIGELYLAEGKARQRLWKRIEAALRNLNVPESRIAHLVKTDNPEYLARLYEELQNKPPNRK